ncbi:MAG: hypothetical protein QXI27_02665 [Nitrososphaerota archaeon]
MLEALLSAVRRLARLMGRDGEEVAGPSGSLALLGEGYAGASPEPGLSVLVDWYRREPYVRYAVDAYAGRIASKFYITSNDPEALNFLMIFLRRNKFSSINRLIARDVVLSGNAFLNVVPASRISNLYLLPLSSISSILRNDSGEVVEYLQNWGGMIRRLPPEEVHHYRFNPIDNAAFGEGLINHLTRPGRGYFRKGRQVRRPPLLEIKERIDNAARLLLEEMPPFFVFKVPLGKRREFSETYNQLLPGQHVVIDYDVFEVKSSQVESRTRFWELWEYLDRQVLTGLKNPLVRLITYTGFSRASAEAALETLEPEISSIQEFLGSEHEALLNRVLESNGFDVELADVRWNWASSEFPEWSIRDVIDLYEAGLLEREEARTIIRELTGLFVGAEREHNLRLMSREESIYVLWNGKVSAVSPETAMILEGRIRNA